MIGLMVGPMVGRMLGVLTSSPKPPENILFLEDSTPLLLEDGEGLQLETES